MNKTSPFEYAGKGKIWDQKLGDKYLVSGVDRNGKKFRYHFEDWKWADSINLWKGCKWLIRDGKRYLIKKVVNY